MDNEMLSTKESRMNERVCPWWLADWLTSPLRRLFQNPEKILTGLVSSGQTVVDLGCGPGFFTVAMAKMAGEAGHVIAVDLQPEMLALARRNAERAGMQSRIRFHQAQADSIGVIERADFAMAMWMVHEVPNAEKFLGEIRSFLKPGGRFLLIEPLMHVSAADFQKTVDKARETGLKPLSSPKIGLSRTMLFGRD
jgi:ubiquinone/menaquinone biosynthesis C-methylase UbiE